ncbi:hypothetical protein ACJJIP_02520 [Microbulbifer sp. VTAC004]|uniref:hypothetical protein n=1 Tax=unclassified Microbulbifer TaxID=2619833 RepID=UPI00403955CF
MTEENQISGVQLTAQLPLDADIFSDSFLAGSDHPFSKQVWAKIIFAPSTIFFPAIDPIPYGPFNLGFSDFISLANHFI